MTRLPPHAANMLVSLSRASVSVATFLVVSLLLACDRMPAVAPAAPAAAVRIDTRTPTTLPDSDMVVMRASVFDAVGNLLPNEAVTWTSRDSLVISVSATGALRGHPWGISRQATIVARVTSNPALVDSTMAYSMFYASGLYLTPNGKDSHMFGQVARLAPGESQPIHAYSWVGADFDHYGNYRLDSLSVDQTVSWISRAPDVATVDVNGVVTGHSDGVATIVAHARGSRAQDSATVVVSSTALHLANLYPGAPMCGLSPAGVAYCWGTYVRQIGPTNTSGPPNFFLEGTRFPASAVAGAPTFLSLSGSGFTCGIANDALTYCWTLGTRLFGGTVARNTPTVYGPNLRFVSMQAGRDRACGLTATGVAYCWGGNLHGGLGDGTYMARETPDTVSGGVRFTSITTANDVTCAIAASGEAYCWGANAFGAVGDGSTTDRLVPTRVATSERFAQLIAGGDHVCGRTGTGQVFCWGYNPSGEVGDGTTTNRTTPMLVAGGNVFTSITVGDAASCGLTQGGRALCWGLNGGGTLGDGTYANRTTPTPVSGALHFSSLANKDLRTCGLADGAYYCWGLNNDGTLGINTMHTVNVPTRLHAVTP